MEWEKRKNGVKEERKMWDKWGKREEWVGRNEKAGIKEEMRREKKLIKQGAE